uniref:L-Fucosyltransferase n=1 Tax=Panagrellus redivivus TaxID=6233 RepID=A0A7E4ZUA6_PANRE
MHKIKYLTIAGVVINLCIGGLYYVNSYQYTQLDSNQTESIVPSDDDDPSANVTLNNYTNVLPDEKFVTLNFWHFAGLGNQFWRIASLYGIAKQINRTPYFNSELPTLTESYEYYAKYFPNIIPSEIIKFIPGSTINETTRAFANGSRQYEDPKHLTNETVQYLRLSSSYVQGYKFFDEYKPFLKNVFQCAPNVVQHTREVAEKANWNLTQHNFCVNTRRGDFVSIPHYRHSSKYFSNPATEFVLDILQQKTSSHVNVIYSSDDAAFTKGLYNESRNGTTFIDSSDLKFNKYESLCFLIHNCDSVLLTATGTTFGWWFAYLKEKPGDIYYDGVLANAKLDWILDDYVPPWWHRVCVESGVPKLVGFKKCQGNSAYPYKDYTS